MEKETKNNVREWTNEDERKFREMFARRKYYEAQKGICESVVGNINNQNIPKTQEDRARCFQQETPMFSQSSEDIAKTLSDAGIKTAEANHKFNMMEIKAKMLADLCNNIIACVPHSVNPQHPEFVTDYANKVVEQTVGKL